jgi:hypothetical protein
MGHGPRPVQRTVIRYECIVRWDTIKDKWRSLITRRALRQRFSPRRCRRLTTNSQLETGSFRPTGLLSDPCTHASRGRQRCAVWQAGHAIGIAQSGSESNCTVSVLKPVETVTEWTGQRTMMSGIPPPFFRPVVLVAPVFGAAALINWNFGSRSAAGPCSRRARLRCHRLCEALRSLLPRFFSPSRRKATCKTVRKLPPLHMSFYFL